MRTLGNIYLKLLNGVLCHKLQAAAVETRGIYVIHHSDEVYSGGPETERSRSFWMQIIMCRNSILAANIDDIDFVYSC